jgi:hypothetical protein
MWDTLFSAEGSRFRLGSTSRQLRFAITTPGSLTRMSFALTQVK